MILNLRQPERLLDHFDLGDIQDGDADNRTPGTVPKIIASDFNTQSAFQFKRLSARPLKYAT